jgi:nucleoside-diphosphate-sugar epimerase
MAAINGKNGINAKSVRVALVYGPGTKKGDKRVLNSFIEQAICSSKIELKDLGLALRTYCYVVDAVEMCFLATINGKELIYNVGGISKTSIADLAKLIAKITNSNLSFPKMRSSYLSGAPADVSLDLSKILTLKNNSSFIGLDEGLKRTIYWQKEVLYS